MDARRSAFAVGLAAAAALASRSAKAAARTRVHGRVGSALRRGRRRVLRVRCRALDLLLPLAWLAAAARRAARSPSPPSSPSPTWPCGCRRHATRRCAIAPPRPRPPRAGDLVVGPGHGWDEYLGFYDRARGHAVPLVYWAGAVGRDAVAVGDRARAPPAARCFSRACRQRRRSDGLEGAAPVRHHARQRARSFAARPRGADRRGVERYVPPSEPNRQ